MKKTILILIVIILLLIGLGAGAYIYLTETTKTVFHSKLSDRSREFLDSQAASSGSQLRGVSLDKKRAGEHDYDSNRVIVKECYSVVIPFDVSDERQNDPCVYYAILESPRGNMTTSLRDVGFTKADQAPDVTMRRQKKEVYKEDAPITGKGNTFLVFSDVTTGVEQTAFGMVGGKLFTVSLSIGGDSETKTRQLKKIVESVELE